MPRGIPLTSEETQLIINNYKGQKLIDYYNYLVNEFNFQRSDTTVKRILREHGLRSPSHFQNLPVEVEKEIKETYAGEPLKEFKETISNKFGRAVSITLIRRVLADSFYEKYPKTFYEATATSYTEDEQKFIETLNNLGTMQLLDITTAFNNYFNRKTTRNNISRYLSAKGMLNKELSTATQVKHYVYGNKCYVTLRTTRYNKEQRQMFYEHLNVHDTVYCVPTSVYVWVKAGRKIKKNEYLTHIDGDFRNNKLENLRLITNEIQMKSFKYIPDGLTVKDLSPEMHETILDVATVETLV